MIDLFGDIAKYIKFDEFKIDNNVFRLHYKGTVAVFVCAALLVNAGQYIGDPIDCIVDGVPSGMMDTYCWIHSTFSIPSRCVVNVSLSNLSSLFKLFFLLFQMGWKERSRRTSPRSVAHS